VTALKFERASEAVDFAEVYTLRELYDNPALLAPPVPIIKRLAYQGRVTLLSAPKKSGKSTLCGAAIAALSAGGTFLGHPTDAVPILWVCLDEPLNDLVRRFNALRADPDQVLVTATRSMARILASAVAGEFSVLVIDTIGDLLVGEVESENDSAQVRRALAPLRAYARDHNAAVVLLHHTGKVSGRSRGSGAFEEIVDLVLTLSRDKDDTTIRRVEAEGRVGVEDFGFRLTADGVALADAEATIQELVEMAVYAEPGCSTNSILERVKRNRNEVHSAIGVLSNVGRIQNTGSRSRAEWRTITPDNTSDNTWANTPKPTPITPDNTSITPPVTGAISPLRGDCTQDDAERAA
jgi:RecA-family ATPase